MTAVNSSIRVSGLGQKTLAALKSNAKAEGLSLEGYVKELITAEMKIKRLARTQSIDQIMAPAQKQVRESGISEEELVDLIVDAREQYRKELSTKKRH